MDSSSSIKRADQKELSDGIWCEIFHHLPLNSIYRFRCVSRYGFLFLQALISLTSSINSTINLSHGHFFMKSDYLKIYITYHHYNLHILHSMFMSRHQTGLSFRFISQELDRLYLYLLGTSNGLVLCTTNIYNQIRYFVCNPLTQKWVSLPPPPPREKNWVVAALICNECFSESSTSYKVIRIPQVKFAAKEFRVEIYSSDLGEWNVVDVSCPPRATWEVTIHDNFVTLNGVLYWFQQLNSEVLAFCVDRNTNDGTYGNECRLINIPYIIRDRYDFTSLSECLGESEGLICFARFKYKERSLSVWVLDVDWYILHKDIQLHDWLAEIETQLCDGSDGRDLITEIRVVGFSPVDKNVVILKFKEYVWAYNTKIRVYEQLCHTSFLRSNVPSVPRLGTLEFVLKPRPTILTPVSWE